MWAYIARRLLYNIPVYLGIILLLMVALRVNDPVYAFLGKNTSEEAIRTLDTSFMVRSIASVGESPFPM